MIRARLFGDKDLMALDTAQSATIKRSTGLALEVLEDQQAK